VNLCLICCPNRRFNPLISVLILLRKIADSGKIDVINLIGNPFTDDIEYLWLKVSYNLLLKCPKRLEGVTPADTSHAEEVPQ